MQRSQQTLANSTHLCGFGYWSGQDVRLEFRPAKPGSGIVFVRRDLDAEARIPATIDYRVEANRRTNLQHGEARVEMVEHILSALAGLQIDNCEIWVDAPEMPGCDGSCRQIAHALRQAGVQFQARPRKALTVQEIVRVGSDEAWVEARPTDVQGMQIEYELDYGSDHILGRSTFAGHVTRDLFLDELAPARTFILEQEAEWLRSQGQGLRVTPQDLLVFGPQGVINNTLRFSDECVRHKALDMIGDLALSGCDLHGSFHAYRSGHKLNAQLVQALLDTVVVNQFSRLSA